MAVIYKLENIYKTYLVSSGYVHALEGVNLSLEEGEVIVILGPSGSGKSTMLNLLSGLDNPTKGKLYYYDKKINKLDDIELCDYRKEHIGFIFQSYHLIPNLTVEENILLGKQLSKNPLDIYKVLKAVGLLNQKNKYPYQLSGGQMQRVAIARSLVKNPEVLFCDEPTGALDEQTGKNVLKFLQDINKEFNTTMIIVTHNPSIASMANTVIKMNSGKVVEVIKNKEIKSAEDLRWS